MSAQEEGAGSHVLGALEEHGTEGFVVLGVHVGVVVGGAAVQGPNGRLRVHLTVAAIQSLPRHPGPTPVTAPPACPFHASMRCPVVRQG